MAVVFYDTPVDFQSEVFGCPGWFPKYRLSGDWVVFHREASLASLATLWHGCTLWELQQILVSGVWKVGLGHPPSQTSPPAVWLATTKSAALERAAAERGWAFSQRPCGIPNGWDCPVVIGVRLDLDRCGLHSRLCCGAELRRYLTSNRLVVPLEELRVVQCSIYKPVYDRFQKLEDVWEDLEAGKLVLCRSRWHDPASFFKSGHGRPWTCGRTCANPNECGWLQADNTREWRCRECDDRATRCRSTLTGEV